jgi:hypothetical protein
MKLKTLMVAASAAAALAMAGAAQASTILYNFDAPGLWSGSFSLNYDAGVASSGAGTINVTGYSPQTLTLIVPSDPGYESPPGYRANDGTDWFPIDQNVPIDGDPSGGGLLFSVGNTSPTFGGEPLFPIYGDGAGGFDTGLFGHIGDGSNFYMYNVATTVTSAVSGVPEAGTWMLLMLGFGGLGGALRLRRKGAVLAVA